MPTEASSNNFDVNKFNFNPFLKTIYNISETEIQIKKKYLGGLFENDDSIPLGIIRECNVNHGLIWGSILIEHGREDKTILDSISKNDIQVLYAYFNNLINKQRTHIREVESI